MMPPSEPAGPQHGRREGVMVLFTGLSGSGKSTVATALVERIDSRTARRAVLLDGDEVRQMLWPDLGFDRASRELNLRRIGFVASLVVQAGGVAVAAPIAPFEASRHEIRERVNGEGAFLLVHVSTPLEVCESRDAKGLYAKARAGLLDDFTGIGSPYEAPLDADVVIDTSQLSVEEAVDTVFAALAGRL